MFHGVLNYAVELDILPANPIGNVTWKASQVAEEIDRRVVASPAQVRQPLAAVASIRPDLVVPKVMTLPGGVQFPHHETVRGTSSGYGSPLDASRIHYTTGSTGLPDSSQ